MSVIHRKIFWPAVSLRSNVCHLFHDFLFLLLLNVHNLLRHCYTSTGELCLCRCRAPFHRPKPWASSVASCDCFHVFLNVTKGGCVFSSVANGLWNTMHPLFKQGLQSESSTADWRKRNNGELAGYLGWSIDCITEGLKHTIPALATSLTSN